MTVMATEKSARSDAKTLAAQLRANLSITGPRSKVRLVGSAVPTTLLVPELLADYHSGRDGDARVRGALQGIDYAISTARISGTTDLYLRNLTPWSWCNLIADVAVTCTTTRQVTQYLNDKIAARAKAWFAEWCARD